MSNKSKTTIMQEDGSRIILCNFKEEKKDAWSMRLVNSLIKKKKKYIITQDGIKEVEKKPNDTRAIITSILILLIILMII